ncbi:hypothetical protein CCHR01_15184 [Colletotrichum chrysophilum]|uniref:Uncharacterized protein n=1 Tax=Colletotrichum chrysophilum TaxID=1836956 RepID=A0AAD9A630_9PEZI|nr:hypothetical protein CCHR01_15184 [Colletotrichum chrysophilum]
MRADEILQADGRKALRVLMVCWLAPVVVGAGLHSSSANNLGIDAMFPDQHNLLLEATGKSQAYVAARPGRSNLEATVQTQRLSLRQVEWSVMKVVAERVAVGFADLQTAPALESRLEEDEEKQQRSSDKEQGTGHSNPPCRSALCTAGLRREVPDMMSCLPIGHGWGRVDRAARSIGGRNGLLVATFDAAAKSDHFGRFSTQTLLPTTTTLLPNDLTLISLIVAGIIQSPSGLHAPDALPRPDNGVTKQLRSVTGIVDASPLRIPLVYLTSPMDATIATAAIVDATTTDIAVAVTDTAPQLSCGSSLLAAEAEASSTAQLLRLRLPASSGLHDQTPACTSSSPSSPPGQLDV